MKAKRIVSGVLAMTMIFGAFPGEISFGDYVDYTVFAQTIEDFGDAVEINVNKTLEDKLTNERPNHIYKFTLSQDGYIYVDFDKEYEDTSISWRVWIYNSEQKVIKEQDFSAGNTAAEQTCKIGVPKGVYYIEVDSDSWNYKYPPTAKYYVKVNYSQDSNWEKEFNDDFLESNSIGLAKKTYGTLQYKEDIDYYKVNVPADGMYRLSFGKEYTDKGSDWEITLYDSEMISIDSFLAKKGDSKTELQDFNLKRGDNYIEVSCNSWNLKSPPMATYNVCLSKAPESLINATVKTSKKKYVYTGKAIKPGVTVKLGSKTLKNGTDYTVSYSDNVYTGVAAVTVNGKGNYTGSARGEFYIIPKKTTIKSAKSTAKKRLKVVWKKNPSADGYQIQVATNRGFTSGKKTGYVKNSWTYYKIFNNLKSKKTYYARVRAYAEIYGKKYYGAWSSIKKVKCK